MRSRGGGGRGRERDQSQPGFDRGTGERIFDEVRGHKQRSHGSGHGKRRKKSFLDELFD